MPMQYIEGQRLHAITKVISVIILSHYLFTLYQQGRFGVLTAVIMKSNLLWIKHVALTLRCLDIHWYSYTATYFKMLRKVHMKTIAKMVLYGNVYHIVTDVPFQYLAVNHPSGKLLQT
jgi:hypothetical protein